MLRVEFQGANPTTIRARAWLAGTAEPTTWLLNTTDSTARSSTGDARRTVPERGHRGGTRLLRGQLAGDRDGDPGHRTANPSGAAHWLYVVDDGTVYVYDIDNNHALVKQFPIPEEGKRGVAVAPGRGLLYISECGKGNCAGANGSLIAYDLVHDVVAWIANYSSASTSPRSRPTARPSTCPTGRTPQTARFHPGRERRQAHRLHQHRHQRAQHDRLAGRHPGVPDRLHRQQLQLRARMDPTTNQVTLNAGPMVNGVRPFTVNGKHTLMFTTSTNTCGFQVLSLTTGQVLYTVPFSGSCTWTASNAPSHGISLSPDETRLYVMDAARTSSRSTTSAGYPRVPPSLVATVHSARSPAGRVPASPTASGRAGSLTTSPAATSTSATRAM